MRNITQSGHPASHTETKSGKIIIINILGKYYCKKAKHIAALYSRYSNSKVIILVCVNIFSKKVTPDVGRCTEKFLFETI
jgi:hypothetical protein